MVTRQTAGGVCLPVENSLFISSLVLERHRRRRPSSNCGNQLLSLAYNHRLCRFFRSLFCLLAMLSPPPSSSSSFPVGFYLPRECVCMCFSYAVGFFASSVCRFLLEDYFATKTTFSRTAQRNRTKSSKTGAQRWWWKMDLVSLAGCFSP